VPRNRENVTHIAKQAGIANLIGHIFGLVKLKARFVGKETFMVLGKRAAVVLAAAVASWGMEAWAQTPVNPQARPPTPPAAVTATPRRPLMELLDQAGAGRTLDDWRLTIGGHVEVSWTYNFDDPDNEVNPGRAFDFEHNDFTMNQLSLFAERKVDVAKKTFDVGGKIEAIFGSDAGLIHANGLTDWYDGPRDPENQLDLTQLYADFALPVGNGLLIRVGKFVTLLNQEVIDPEGNALFSHSFLFTFSAPFTHTGIIASYNLTDQWSITGGITRGWDQAWEDNNDGIDFLGQVKWAASKDTTLILNVSIGPQRTDNNDDYRYVLDLVASHAVSDQLSLAVNADFGWEDDAALDGDTATWYGVAGYVGYKLTDMFTVNGRLEWFRDNDGARTGLDINLYEATVGLAIKPLPKDKWGQWLQIRPELRWDHADEDVFNDFSDEDQFTFGVDVLFAY